MDKTKKLITLNGRWGTLMYPKVKIAFKAKDVSYVACHSYAGEEDFEAECTICIRGQCFIAEKSFKEVTKIIYGEE